MITAIRDLYIRHKVRREHAEALEYFNRQIAEGRKRHLPIKHLERQRQAYTTACLKGRGR